MQVAFFRRTQKCTRCGSRYSREQTQCPYCSGISDSQLRTIRGGRRPASELPPGTMVYIIGAIVLIIAIRYMFK